MSFAGLYVFQMAMGYAYSQQILHLVALGDWGGMPVFPYRTFVELSIGRELDVFASKVGVDAIIALGDNFYFNGVSDVDDPRFEETFEKAFNFKSYLHVPWLVVAGNHDHYGNVSAQIAYSAHSERWTFPDFYYKKQFRLPNSNMTVDIIMIDTIILCGNTDQDHPYAQPKLDLKFQNRQIQHWKWLDKMLISSRANYLLVCGHYPVYSVATHGPTKCLVDHLKPLLEKYRVSAYFSGHDHSMQHIQTRKDGLATDYVVSGSANFIDPSKVNLPNIPEGSLLFHWGDMFSLGAFNYIKIGPTNMTVVFLSSLGKPLYSFNIGPRFI